MPYLANKRMLEYTSKLENLNECLRKLYSIAKKYTTITSYKKANWMVKDAVERNIQKSIEIIIDMGKMLISDRKYKIPESNYEVFEVLVEEKELPIEYLDLIKKVIGTRNKIIHNYERVDDEIFFSIIKKHLKEMKLIADLIFSRVKGLKRT